MIIQFLLAIIMTIASFYVIYEIEKWRSVRRVLVSLYVEGMMGVMNIGAYIYLAYHDIFIPLAINGSYMFFALYALLETKNANKRIVYTLFAVSMALAELFMGSLLYTLSTGLPATFNDSVENIWFLGMMLSEMGFTFILSFKTMDIRLRNYLVVLLLLMPWLPEIFPPNVAFWLSSAVMIGATILIYDTLYQTRLMLNQDTLTALELMIIFTVMMIGGFVYFLYGSLTVYDASMLLSMFWFLYRSLNGPNGKRINCLKSPRVAFSLIFVTFVMEFFMGAVLDFVQGVFSPTVQGFLNSLSLPWLNPNSLMAILWDGIDIIGSVLGSTWFLVMMGIEMGFLAFKKMLEMRVKEIRVRMLLMIIAYGVYSIYLPSFSPIADKLPYIPYMWSMGIGTLGPVTKSTLLGLIGTYVVYGILSFLFGSRNLCAVTCTAPMMYQGTFYDSMKIFNRKAKVGKRLLTSKFRGFPRLVALLVSIIVLVSAILSYLNSMDIIRVNTFSVDLTVLIYFIWFDIMWYVLFVSIPFLGTFACVTTGYCYWGVFNQAVSRLGFFRLKVRNPGLCVDCKTVDCASACPVGITDMRGEFIKRGEMKSFKCIGIGECINACPYNNIYIYDVRHWIKGLFKHEK